MRRTSPGLLVFAAMIIIGAVLVTACDESDGDEADHSAMEMGTADRGTPVAEIGHLAIYAPYVPAPPADIAALYFVVVNEGDSTDRLLKISSGAAGMAMLHETVVDGDASRMSPLEAGLDLPPAGEVALAPGGYHGMLMNLVEPLEVGDVVHVTLEFEGAGTVMIEVPVTDGVPESMEDMGHDDE